MKQLFSLANLIFINSKEEDIDINTQNAVLRRFKSILDSFIGAYVAERQTTSNNNNVNSLPYGSQSAIGDIVIGEYDNHLVLYFSMSFDAPTMFIYDNESKKVRNYIDFI